MIYTHEVSNQEDYTLENKKLFLGNLNHSATKEQVREIFEPFGTISDVIVLEGKGFGFIEFSSVEEATKAKDSLDGQEFLGRSLKVDYAKPRTDRNNGPRRPYKRF